MLEPSRWPRRECRHKPPIAVTIARRSQALPELPVIADSVPGYGARAVTGICAPRGTPQ
ncbi:MAG: hypothetical protein IT537_20175 [Hyphomicrobiales bacterium]|nr:hypothetical protein [Hyphomicrobiales bacterium]